MKVHAAIPITAFVFLGLSLAGCGAKSSDSNTSGSPASAPAAGTVSKYDAGPRAAEQPVNEEMAKSGEKLFKEKGCSACHAFGARLSGPDLKGVTLRRTALWMENQILHPEVMVKEDPISRKMFAEFALQMTNQHLTPAEAKAVIEYLKHQDHEAAESH